MSPADLEILHGGGDLWVNAFRGYHYIYLRVSERERLHKIDNSQLPSGSYVQAHKSTFREAVTEESATAGNVGIVNLLKLGPSRGAQIQRE